ncbi:MAG: hypothetical protein WD206_07775 [Actinomycetota bacterium]
MPSTFPLRANDVRDEPAVLTRRQLLVGGALLAGGLLLGASGCSGRGGRLGWNETADWSTAERMFFRGPFTADDLRPALSAGRRPIVSVKLSQPWAGVAAGASDADLDLINAALSEIDGVADITFHHEPENDEEGHPNVVSPAGTAEQYRAATRRFVDRAVEGTGATYALCLMGSGYEAGAEGGPERWDAGVEGSYAADPYNRWGADGDTWRSLAELVEPMAAYADRQGTGCGVWETNAMEDPADPDRKGRWIREAAATATEIEMETLVFFDGGEFAWQLLSSPQAMSAVESSARTEYFTA